MNLDLFTAIVAMDSYNRGYGSAVDFGTNSDAQGTRIGNATVFWNKGDSVAQAAGFYAIAYTYNGGTVIAYRGTDKVAGLDGDLLNGWVLGGGLLGRSTRSRLNSLGGRSRRPRRGWTSSQT